MTMYNEEKKFMLGKISKDDLGRRQRGRLRRRWQGSIKEEMNVARARKEDAMDRVRSRADIRT